MKTILLLLLCATTLTYAGTLTHRYSFNGDATDSIAYDQADASLYNGVTISNNQAAFPGGTGSANENTPIVDFPGKVWQNLTEVTLEMWVTPEAGNGDYTPIAYFKGSDGVAAALSAIRHQRLFYGGYADFNPPATICDANVETHFTVTMKGTAFKLYKNGALFFEGTLNGAFDVPDAEGLQCWLGKAQWDHEPAFVGSVNEFRIYNFAISAHTISNNFSDGPNGNPDVPPAPTTYYVSQTGSDSNDGLTPGTAFNSVKHAMDQVVSEDIVHVLAGHYTNEFSHGLSNTNAIPMQRVYAGLTSDGFLTDFTLRGDGPDKTFFYNMLDTNNFSDTSPRAFYITGTGTTLKDFSVTVENYPDSGDYAAAFYGWSCTNCTVENVAVKMDNTGQASGIMFLYGTYVYQNTIKNVLVDGGIRGVYDRFWDLGTGSTHSHDTVIEHCTFVNQVGFGVALQTMPNTVIENCIFENCGAGAVYKQTGQIGGNPVTNDVILTSIINHNTPVFVVVDNGAGCETIIVSNGIYGVDPMLVTYNDFPSCSKYYGTAGWKGAPFGSSAPLAAEPWPLVGNGTQRKGYYYGGPVFSSGNSAWVNNTLVGVGLWGSGAADDKYYYIGTNKDPGELLVIDKATGADVAMIDFNDWWDGAPAVGDTVVFGSDNSGNIYAVEKETWLVLWNVQVAGACNGALLLSDDKLYIDVAGKGLYCLDATSGEQLWLFETGINNWSGNGAVTSPDESQVYIRNASGNVFALNAADGTLVWSNQFAVSTQNPSGGGIVDDSGNVYFMADDGPASYYMVSYTSAGAYRWNYAYGAKEFDSHASFALSQDGATIYSSGLNGLTAVNTTDGTLKWTTNVGTTKGGCVVANGDIIIGVYNTGSGAETVAVKDDTTAGTVSWSLALDGSGDTWSYPTLLDDGSVVVASQNGPIMRIKVASGSARAPEPWPVYGNGIQRKGYYTGGMELTAAGIVWTNTTQIGPSSAGIYGSGAADDTHLYVAVDPYNVEEYEMLAISLADGTLDYGAHLVDWANGTPAVATSYVYCGDNAGFVYCIDKTDGSVIWSNDIGGDINSGLNLNGGVVYAKSAGVGVFALNADTGAPIWSNLNADASCWTGNGPSLNADGSALYYKTEQGEIVGVDTSDGSTIFSVTNGAAGWGGQDPIVDDAGNVYGATRGTDTVPADDVVVSLTPAGAINWTYTFTGHPMDHGGMALSEDQATLYVSSNEGITALNTADGTMKWTTTGVNQIKGGLAVGAGNMIMAVARQGASAPEAAAIGVKDNGTSGDLVWQVPLDAGVDSWSGPVLLANGDVVVLTDGGEIARITVPEPGVLGALILGLLLLIRRK